MVTLTVLSFLLLPLMLLEMLESESPSMVDVSGTFGRPDGASLDPLIMSANQCLR